VSEAEIASLRGEIASVDREIVGLVARRLYLAEQIGLEKRLSGQPVRVTEVEAQVAARIGAEGKARGIGPEFARSLSRLLIEESVHRQEALAPPETGAGTALVVGGAGRMGRWLCRYLETQGYRVTVHDAAGPRVDLSRVAATADVVAVAVPMDAAASVLETIGAAKPSGLVFDVASLKTPVAHALRSLAGKGCTVASVHPLFGPHFGPLSQATILLSDCGRPAGLERARRLFRGSGAHLVDVPLEDHDEIMATVLGLSHLTLLAFARAVARAPFDVGLIPTEGTTFARLAAVARGLMDDSPALLREVQALNPHTPDVRRHLLQAIEDWTRAAADSDGKAFVTLLEESRNVGGAPR
jgi:chorismate mutase/prephenate dehydrogenase